jgi:elongation factor Ts
MAITTADIKALREETNAGIMDCRKALEEAGGDFNKALEELRKKGLEKAADRAEREAAEGVVELYSHGDGRVGVMVEVNCETDFVARSEAFRNFAHEIALQVAAASPKYVHEDDIPEQVLAEEIDAARTYALESGKPESIIDRIVEGRLNKFKDETCLLRQPYIRDDEITVNELLLQNVAAMGENVIIRRIERWELGELSAINESD